MTSFFVNAEAFGATERSAFTNAEAFGATERSAFMNAEAIGATEKSAFMNAEAFGATEKSAFAVAEAFGTTEKSATTVAEAIGATERSATTVAEAIGVTEKSATTVAEAIGVTEKSATTVAEAFGATERSATTVAEAIGATEKSATEKLRFGEVSQFSPFLSNGDECEFPNILHPFSNTPDIGRNPNFADMKNITIRKVQTKKEMNDFVNFADELYADCPYYVPDLRADVRNTFDPKKNPGLEFSDIQPFVAYDEEGRTVGRIAGIINHHANEKWKTRNVRFGFFDFIDRMDVSAALLGTVEGWGKAHGMDAIQGPMGITDFDKEGMLIEDFDRMGSINTLYNHPYYPQHMEALGYRKEVDWVQVRIDVPQETPEKYARVARLSKEMFGLKTRKISNRDITRGGYGRQIFQLLNTAYAPIFGFAELSEKQIDNFIEQYLQLVDKELMTVVENETGELIGVAVTMCSLSNAMRKTGGRLLPLGWYHLLKALKWKPEDNAEMLLVAVRPDYQMLGVNALFFDDLIPIYNRHGIRWAETGPQLEDNVRELTQWKPLNPTFTKRRRCYRKDL